jgi:DegV family protein with EDD domain
MSPVAIVTDSTAGISPELAVTHGITVVPLHVIVGEEILEEGEGGATPELVADALRSRKAVSTSRPTPAAFLAAYDAAAASGATAVVSIHLSSKMSGTLESAELAAREASIPVLPVDSRQVGIATGFAVLTATELRDAGVSEHEIAEAAKKRAVSTKSLFYVDTLEYLRRGGRIGAAAAFVGGALSVKPILWIRDGEVASLDKVRTSSRALLRLADLAAEAAGSGEVDIGVAHLANQSVADDLADLLSSRLSANLSGREVLCGEVGAALGAHVGPGMVAVCVAPRFPS